MVRTTLFLSIIFALLGAIYFIFISNKASKLSDLDNTSQTAKLYSVVISSKNIRKGEVFSSSNLSTKDLDLSKIPQDAIMTQTILYDRRAEKNIEQGHFISREDILPSDRLKWTKDDEFRNEEASTQVEEDYLNVIYPIQDIPQGDRVETLMLTQKHIRKSKVPKGSLNSLRQIAGTRAKYGLSQGQIITKFDLIHSIE